MGIQEILSELRMLDTSRLYERDWLSFRRKTDQEMGAVFAVSDALMYFLDQNYDVSIFRSGLALWEGGEEKEFFSFAKACNLLGLKALRVSRVDEAVLVGAAPDVISAPEKARCELLAETAETLYRKGLLRQRPLTVAPEQALGLALSLVRRFGGVEPLRGKGLAVLPDGDGHPTREGEAIEMGVRLGMKVRYFPGQEPLDSACLQEISEQIARTGGSFEAVEEWQSALEGAEVIWPNAPETDDFAKELRLGEEFMPYIMAAIVFLGKVPKSADLLGRMAAQGVARRLL